MSADEEKTTMEAAETTESSAGGTAAGKGGTKKLIMFGGIGLVAMIVGIAVAMFVIKPMMSDPGGEGTEELAVDQTDRSHDDKQDQKPKRKKVKKGHGEEVSSVVYALKDIVVNPAGTGGSRFLSVSLGFKLESVELEAEFEAMEPMVRDALITILSSKTVSQLTDPKQKEIVRYQIKKRVSHLMATDELAAVYFTDFVLQ